MRGSQLFWLVSVSVSESVTNRMYLYFSWHLLLVLVHHVKSWPAAPPAVPALSFFFILWGSFTLWFSVPTYTIPAILVLGSLPTSQSVLLTTSMQPSACLDLDSKTLPVLILLTRSPLLAQPWAPTRPHTHSSVDASLFPSLVFLVIWGLGYHTDLPVQLLTLYLSAPCPVIAQLQSIAWDFSTLLKPNYIKTEIPLAPKQSTWPPLDTFLVKGHPENRWALTTTTSNQPLLCASRAGLWWAEPAWMQSLDYGRTLWPIRMFHLRTLGGFTAWGTMVSKPTATKYMGRIGGLYDFWGHRSYSHEKNAQPVAVHAWRAAFVKIHLRPVIYYFPN